MSGRVFGKKRFVLFNRPWFPFLVYFCVLLVLFAGVTPWFSDDELLREALVQRSPVSLALEYRALWSGRLLIELVFFSIYKLPLWIWKLAQSGVIVLAAYALSALAGTVKNTRMNWLACGVVALYPLTEMTTASWISGSAMYIWVIAFGLYAMLPWRQLLCGEKPRPHTCLLALLAQCYAASSEQMLALFCGGTFVAILYLVVKRRRPAIYMWVSLVALAAVGALVLLSPGPSLRTASEVRIYYPDFAAVGPYLRAYDCFVAFSRHFIGFGNSTLLAASAGICLAVWQRHKDRLYRFIGGFPLAVGLVMGPLYPVFKEVFPALERLTEAADVQSAGRASAYLPFVLYAMVWMVLLAGVYLAFEGAKGGLFALVLFAGLCSQMVLSFSPSITASQPRVYIYLHFALLAILFAVLYQSLRWPDRRMRASLQGGVGVFASLSVLNLFLSV